MRNIKLHSLIMIIISNLLMNCTKINEDSTIKGEVLEIGINNIQIEEMDEFIPIIDKKSNIVISKSNNSNSIDNETIGYSIGYGNKNNNVKLKLAAVEKPINTQWRYKLLAYRQDGSLADTKTYIRGNATSESQTLSLITGETYTFVCYSQFNTTNIGSNDATTTLAEPSTTNLNTATLSNGIDGGASFMYWKETITLTPGLKLNINLRHQFYGYQVTVNAPAGYSFKIIDAGNTSGHGARLFPVENTMTIKLSDASISNASNTSGLNPNTQFLSTINGYGAPYNRLGRLVRFINPINGNQLYSALTTPPYVTQLTCRETSFLTISNESSGTYPTNKTIFRIAQIQLRNNSTLDESSIQELVIPNLEIKRYKMNRININLLPPASLL